MGTAKVSEKFDFRFHFLRLVQMQLNRAALANKNFAYAVFGFFAA
jgi:hypothetical protein